MTLELLPQDRLQTRKTAKIDQCIDYTCNYVNQTYYACQLKKVTWQILWAIRYVIIGFSEIAPKLIQLPRGKPVSNDPSD